MDETILEILEYTDEGYKPMVDYGDWRVAVLRYIDELIPNRISYLERHMETDEVFVLLTGQGVLFLGGNAQQPSIMDCQVMEAGKLYNVRKSAWHNIVLSRDATVLLVENRNTTKANTEYWTLSPGYREFIVETARREQPEWWE